MALILNKPQAEAVFNAMCALNNVGIVSCEFNLPNDVWMQAGSNGAIAIVPRVHGSKMEMYESKADFATTYGVN